MKLAVILPAYNAENFLTECLDSLLNQTFSDFCILAVNDASTDNTGDILESYATKDARLRVYHLPQNQGEPAVMQFAMNMLNYMNVEYVARMDADDICVPHRFEKQVQHLDEHPEIDILGSNALLFNDGQTDKTTKISTLPLLDKDIKLETISLIPLQCGDILVSKRSPLIMPKQPQRPIFICGYNVHCIKRNLRIYQSHYCFIGYIKAKRVKYMTKLASLFNTLWSYG